MLTNKIAEIIQESPIVQETWTYGERHKDIKKLAKDIIKHVESNAHLIASAPVLLEACKEAKQFIFDESEMTTQDRCVIQILERAIKQTKGV